MTNITWLDKIYNIRNHNKYEWSNFQINNDTKTKSKKSKYILYTGDQRSIKYFLTQWTFHLVGTSDCGLFVEWQRSGKQVREKGSKGAQEMCLIQTLRKIGGFQCTY